jgi:hypothetical protein
MHVQRHAQRRRRLVCRATPSGAAQPDAGPTYSAWQLSRATTDGAAALCAAPSQLARQKRVIQVNFFDEKFIFKNCLNFGLFLFKSPIYWALS